MTQVEVQHGAAEFRGVSFIQDDSWSYEGKDLYSYNNMIVSLRSHTE